MKFRRSLSVICLAACCLTPWSSALAEPDDPARAEMNPVVVTATRTKHSLGDVSAAVSVVTRKELDQISAQNVLDVLRTMSGVTVDSDRSSFGSSTYNKVIIRGMGGNTQGRVLVLVDGMPAMPAGTNIFEWNSINLDAVERIEVVRGPSSALYGSSAMGGVINIITRTPPKDGFTATLDTKYGSYNTWDSSLYHAGAVGKFNYSLSGSYLTSYGFNGIPEHSSKPGSNQKPGYNDDGTGVRNVTGAARVGYRFDDTADITLSADLASNLRTGQYNFDDDYRLYEYHKTGFGLRLHKDFGVVDSSLAFRADFLHTDYDSIGGTASSGYRVDYVSPTRQEQYTLDQQNTFALGEHQLVTVGVAASYGRSDQSLDYSPLSTYKDRVREKGGSQYTLAGYIQDEISLFNNSVQIIPGLRYDVIGTDGYDEDSTNKTRDWRKNYGMEVDSRLTPKLGLRVNPWDGLLVFRANYGEAFRSASLDERFGEYAYGSTLYKGSPDLKPELSRTLDAGFDFSPLKELTFGVTGYITWAEDYIASIKDDTKTGDYFISQKQNIDSVQITGLEGEASWKATEYLTLFANGTILNPQITSGQYKGNQIPFTPTSKATLGFTFAHPDWFTLRVGATWTGPIWTDQANQEANQEGNFWLGEVRISKRFDFRDWWVEPYAELLAAASKEEVRYTNTSRIPTNMTFVGIKAGF